MATDVLRKNRGLGMLLASMGSNKGGNEGGGAAGDSKGITKERNNEQGKVASQQSSGGNDASANQGDAIAGGSQRSTEESNSRQVPNVAQEDYQGFDLASSGFSGWGDISSNPRDGGTVEDPIVITQENNSGQGRSGNTSAGAQEQKSKLGKGTKAFQDEDVYGPRNMNRWADIKEYNDDHDGEWFEEENKRLAKLYGGNFIYVKYLESQPGRVGYFCQLCSAEMNARKSLELHCRGMKHLKRKDQWEKGEQSQEHCGNDGLSETGPRQPGRWPTRDPYRSPANTWSDRGHPRRESYGGHRHHMDSGPYRRPPSPEYRNDRGHYDRRNEYDRYSDNYYDDYYKKDMYRPPYDNRDPYDGRKDSPDMRHVYDHHPGPARRDAGDRYSRDRFNPYGRREPPPPPVISGSSKHDHGKVPRAPSINDVDVATSLLFEGISDGSCNELLKKLSSCRVKSWEDAALATNVATFLVTSLREYYSKIGPPTTVHVLDEIVLKINIMKDLQK